MMLLTSKCKSIGRNIPLQLKLMDGRLKTAFSLMSLFQKQYSIEVRVIQDDVGKLEAALQLSYGMLQPLIDYDHV